MSKLKVELHVHSYASYDTNTSLKRLIDTCLKNNIDAIAITDHNRINVALRLKEIAPFMVIIGEEILTKEGEIIGLFIKKFIKPGQTLANTISEIKKQGGVTYLPHPFDFTTRKTALELNSIERDLNKIDIVEVHNGRTVKQVDNIAALEFAEKHDKLKAVGSDSHTYFELGRNYMLMENFNGPKSFLHSLEKAEFNKSKVFLPAFITTKYVRYKKRRMLDKPKNILSTSRKCGVCDGGNFEVVYKRKGRFKSKYFITDDSYGVHGQIVKCLDCGLVFVEPNELKDKVVKRYIDFVDEKFEKERKARAEGQRRVLENINVISPGRGKLLEIGCASGHFLEIARQDGWDVSGIEPSKWASKIARERYSLNVYTGTLKSENFPKNNYDVVVCIDVVEHVLKPKKLLKNINRILTKDGLVVIVTPDINSVLARLLEEKWWHIRQDHIYYFSENSLRNLIFSAGFKNYELRRYVWSFSLEYWLSRVQGYSKMLYKTIMKVMNNNIGKRILARRLPINFHDSLEFYVKEQ